jgi:hypothetical protein
MPIAWKKLHPLEAGSGISYNQLAMQPVRYYAAFVEMSLPWVRHSWSGAWCSQEPNVNIF